MLDAIDEDGCLQELVTVGHRIHEVVQKKAQLKYEKQLSNHLKRNEHDMQRLLQTLTERDSQNATMTQQLNAKKCELADLQHTSKEQLKVITEQKQTIKSLEKTIEQLQWHKNRSDAIQKAIADYECKNPSASKRPKRKSPS